MGVYIGFAPAGRRRAEFHQQISVKSKTHLPPPLGRGGQSCRRDTPQLFQKHTPHWVPDVLPWWDCNALRIAGPYLLRGHGSVWEKLPQSSTEKQVIWWEWSCLTGKPVECVFVPSSGVARLSVVELVGEGQLTRSLMRTGFMRELHEELIWLNYRCSFDFTSLVTINIRRSKYMATDDTVGHKKYTYIHIHIYH